MEFLEILLVFVCIISLFTLSLVVLLAVTIHESNRAIRRIFGEDLDEPF